MERNQQLELLQKLQTLSFLKVNLGPSNLSRHFLGQKSSRPGPRVFGRSGLVSGNPPKSFKEI